MSAEREFGLYLHIPFCSFLCHYCDFAKTARWDDALAQAYFQSLGAQLKAWLAELQASSGLFTGFTSVNIGGGTPSLFAAEYEPLLNLITPHLAQAAEISLEANPADITDERLTIWRSLGFNRLSLGVQTLQAEGLAFLKRDHDGATARRAIDRALSVIGNVNADLIYSWQGQTQASWQADLEALTGQGVSHLSLYNLTYAAKTPLGRAHARGRLPEAPEEEQEASYEMARSMLAQAGYEHDEVSNWALPGATCRHNWLYWRAAPYLGIGAGACGFLPHPHTAFGLRYAYTPSLRPFTQLGASLPLLPYSRADLQSGAVNALSVEGERDAQAWLTEYVGCGLRCREGIDLTRIASQSAYAFKPTAFVADALAQGLLQAKGGRLYLQPREWFRETAWSLAVLDCFVRSEA